MAQDKLKERLMRRIAKWPSPMKMVELQDYDFQKMAFASRRLDRATGGA